jgi:amino acid transporter
MSTPTGQGSKIFALITLAPFVIFCITGWASGKFDASRWFRTDGGFDNLALYLSVLLWANCGYEYSGFLASTFALNGGVGWNQHKH